MIEQVNLMNGRIELFIPCKQSTLSDQEWVEKFNLKRGLNYIYRIEDPFNNMDIAKLTEIDALANNFLLEQEL